MFTNILIRIQGRKRKTRGGSLFQLRGFILSKKEMQLFFSSSFLRVYPKQKRDAIIFQPFPSIAKVFLTVLCWFGKKPKSLHKAQPCKFLWLPAHKGSLFHVNFINIKNCDFIDSNDILIMKSLSYNLYFCKAEILQKVLFLL